MSSGALSATLPFGPSGGGTPRGFCRVLLVSIVPTIRKRNGGILGNPGNAFRQVFFERGKFAHGNGDFLPFSVQAHALGGQIDTGHGVHRPGSAHLGSGVGEMFPQFVVGGVFVAHATHESSTESGYFYGVQGKILFLHHADADGREAVKPTAATAL